MNKYQDNMIDYLIDLAIEEMEQNEKPCEQRGFFLCHRVEVAGTLVTQSKLKA